MKSVPTTEEAEKAWDVVSRYLHAKSGKYSNPAHTYFVDSVTEDAPYGFDIITLHGTFSHEATLHSKPIKVRDHD